MKKSIFIATILGIFLICTFVFAYPFYVGYSGAPGTSGKCASTCHGSTGGTIQIAGFPTEYVPDSTYTVTISHSGGSSITNFNGSCRIGSGSQNAGIITAGTNTSVYNVTNETNGIHFSSNNQSSGTFNWTAPGVGIGDVKIYIAGQQGNKNGPNTDLVSTATELVSGIHGNNGNIPTDVNLFQNYPNPFNPETKIEFAIPQQGNVTLDIYNATGQKIKSLIDKELNSGYYEIHWDASNYASGVYFYTLSAGDRVITKRMTLLK